MAAINEKFLEELLEFDLEAYNRLTVNIALRLGPQWKDEEIEDINDAFIWSSSPEGVEYWRRLDDAFDDWRAEKRRNSPSKSTSEAKT